MQQLQRARVGSSIDGPSRAGIELQMMRSDEVDREYRRQAFRKQLEAAVSAMNSKRSTKGDRADAIRQIMKIHGDELGYFAFSEEEWIQLLNEPPFWEVQEHVA